MEHARRAIRKKIQTHEATRLYEADAERRRKRETTMRPRENSKQAQRRNGHGRRERGVERAYRGRDGGEAVVHQKEDAVRRFGVTNPRYVLQTCLQNRRAGVPREASTPKKIEHS